MEANSFEESNPSSGLFSTFIPIAFGLIGIVLGAMALYFSTSRGDASAEIEIKEIRKEFEILQKQLADCDMRLNHISENETKLTLQFKAVTDQTQMTLNQLRQELNYKRPTYVAASESPPEAIPTHRQDPIVAARQPNTQGSLQGLKDYTIQDGDTFARIASKYKFSLNTLIEANPTVDPKKLRVGQKIKLPL